MNQNQSFIAFCCTLSHGCAKRDEQIWSLRTPKVRPLSKVQMHHSFQHGSLLKNFHFNNNNNDKPDTHFIFLHEECSPCMYWKLRLLDALDNDPFVAHNFHQIRKIFVALNLKNFIFKTKYNFTLNEFYFSFFL